MGSTERFRHRYGDVAAEVLGVARSRVTVHVLPHKTSVDVSVDLDGDPVSPGTAAKIDSAARSKLHGPS